MSIHATGQSYRTINNWDQHGLLENSRIEKTSWRKFSLMDCVWIKIISDLRTFGYPLKKLRIVKDNLWKTGKDQESILDHLINSYTKLDYNLLLVYPNGDIDLLSCSSKKNLSKLRNHICISLLEYFDFFVDNEFQHVYNLKLSDFDK